MKAMLGSIFLGFVLVGTAQADCMAHSRGGILGDDDPFPVACTDFSGRWRSDRHGRTFEINQKRCSWLQIRESQENPDSGFTIVPDGKTRTVQGHDWTGTVRHSWNSLSCANMVKTHRTRHYRGYLVTELVTLEETTPDLLLETTYRTTENLDPGFQGEPMKEIEQVLLRRESALGPVRKPGRGRR